MTLGPLTVQFTDMPRISLANIPQAPGPGPGPAMIQTPGFRVNMAGAANGLMQREQNAAPYVAAAGMGAIAEGVGQAGNVFSQLSAEMARSKNVADIARAEAVMIDAQVAHAQEIATLPETEWNKVWEEKYRPQVAKGIEGLNLSTWSRERVEPMTTHFDSRVRTETAYAARKQTLQRDEQAILNGQQKMRRDRNYAGAIEQTALLVESGHRTPEQAEKINMGILEEQNNVMVADMTDADPDALIAGIDSGSIKVTPGTEGRIKQQAELSKRRKVSESNDYLDQQVLTRDMKDPEKIRQWGEAHGLSERDIQSHISSATKVFLNTPEGRAEVLAVQNEIKGELYRIDASADDENGRPKFDDLKRKARSKLPVGPKGDTLDLIDKYYSDNSLPTTVKTVRKDLYDANRRAADADFYGERETKEGKWKSEERVNQIDAAIDEYLRNPPDDYKENSRAWFDNLIAGEVQKNMGNAAAYNGSKTREQVYWDSPSGVGWEKSEMTLDEASAEIDAGLKLPE